MATTIRGSDNFDTADIAASKLTGALPAIDGSALTSVPAGILCAFGPVNGGVNSASSASPQDHTIFTFTMPENKTVVVLSGSWSFYAGQHSNGWALARFFYISDVGSISEQSSNWTGSRDSGSTSGADTHGTQGQSSVLTGVSPGQSVTISLRLTPYSSAFAQGLYATSQISAIAY
jgi:hypothetical protein